MLNISSDHQSQYLVGLHFQLFQDSCLVTAGDGCDKNIDSSNALQYIFSQLNIDSLSIQASDHPWSLAGPLGPRLKQLKASRPRPRLRVRG